MRRAYWYGTLLFLIGVIIQIIPGILPPLIFQTPQAFFENDTFIIGIFGPLPTFWDHLLITVLTPLLMILGVTIGGFLLAPLYLGVHRLVYSRTRFYGFIQNKRTPAVGRWLRRAILPTLFAVFVYVTLASLIVENPESGLLDLILDPTLLLIEAANPVTLKNILWGFTGLFGAFATFFIVAPTWFLDDAGLLTANIELASSIQSKNGELPNITGVGTWLSRLLKGYAGISVILLYAGEIIESLAISWTIFLLFPEQELIFFITNMVMFPLFPILLLLMSLPALMVLDKIFESRQSYVFSLGAALGITSRYNFEKDTEVPD